jgi:MAC/Perforin domain
MRPITKSEVKVRKAKCALLIGVGLLPGLLVLTAAPAIAQDATSPAQPSASPPLPRCVTTDPTVKVASWDTDVYLCITAADIRVADDKPQGIGGGVLQSIALPRGAYVTKVHVFHDSTRVYGLKFSYKLNGSTDTSEKETAVIGGTAGEESVVEADRDAPLHFIKGYYGPDPAKHYRTDVLLGIDVGVHKFNVLKTVQSDVSYNETFETQSFGATGTNPASALGFDVHLVHALTGINACTSPNDRNGRIFALGATVGAGVVSRSPAGTEMCPNTNPGWAAQPLGPKRKPKETLGKRNPAKFDPANDSLFDFASGTYEKEGERMIRVHAPNTPSNDLRGSVYNAARPIIAQFDDQATIRYGGLINPRMTMALVTDQPTFDRLKGQLGGHDFRFIYSNGATHVGVELEQVGETSLAYLSHFTSDRNGAYLNGRYREVRLRDQAENRIASRERERADNKGDKQSKKGLFEIGANTEGYGFIYRGYDAPEMSLENVTAGMKAPIFIESGPFQYYASSFESKIVNDGILVDPIGNLAWTDEGQTILSNEKEVVDSVSHSIAANVNIRGVKAGGRYAQTETDQLNQSKNTVRGFAISQVYDFAMVQDIPNSFLSVDFVARVRELFNAGDAGRRAALANQFIAIFGTHYAQAVIFGGSGVLKSEMDAVTFAQKREKSQSYGATAGIEIPGKKPPGGGDDKSKPPNSGEIEYSGSRSNMIRTANNTERNETNWRSRGGVGSFQAVGWSVPKGSAVPIYYDLRPLDNLIEPVILSKVFAGQPAYNNTRAEEVRVAVKTAIENRFASFPPITPVTRPALWQFRIKGITCSNGGDDGFDKTIGLFGKVKLVMLEGDETREVAIFDRPATDGHAVGFGTNVDLKCDQKVDTEFLRAPPQLTWRNAGDPLKATLVAELIEDDNSWTDRDDLLNYSFDIPVPTSGDAQEYTVRWVDDKAPGSPMLWVDVVWEKLN